MCAVRKTVRNVNYGKTYFLTRKLEKWCPLSRQTLLQSVWVELRCSICACEVTKAHTKTQKADIRRRTVTYIFMAERVSTMCIYSIWILQRGLQKKPVSIRSMHNRSKTKSIRGYLFSPSPPEWSTAERRGILYTNKFHDTNQKQAFLKHQNATKKYSTIRRRTSGFYLLVCSSHQYIDSLQYSQQKNVVSETSQLWFLCRTGRHKCPRFSVKKSQRFIHHACDTNM